MGKYIGLLVGAGCIGLFLLIGFIIGAASGYGVGYEDGVQDGVNFYNCYLQQRLNNVGHERAADDCAAIHVDGLTPRVQQPEEVALNG